MRRAIVLVERHDRSGRAEVVREIQDVAHSRGAERIDRLRVIPDHSQAAAVGLEREQDRGLQAVRVLVFVDQHVVEAACNVRRDRRLRHHLSPVKKEVIVVENVLVLLGLDIGGEQPPELGVPHGAPREHRAKQLIERRFGIDRARVDRKARALSGKSLLGLRKSEVVPDQVHEVGGILAVVDREGPVEADLLRVFAYQARADSVKGP